MEIAIGERWENFVTEVVETGRYDSASAVVREGLRLVEERERKLAALRARIQHSIDRGGENTDDDIGAAIDAWTAALNGNSESANSTA